MRNLIGLLLALNLGVFLAGMALQRWSPAAPTASVFNAEKIRLLASPTAADSDSHSARQALPSPASAAPLEPVDPLDPVDQISARGEANPRCLSWTSLDAPGLAAVETHLKQAGIALSAYDIKLEKPLGWWVFLPPLEDAAEVQARIDAVRLLGITDFATVRGGVMRGALSLGAFSNLAQARAHAATLDRKGIQGVLFGPRPEAGSARLVFAASIADAALPDIPNWPKGLRPAPCASP